MLWEHSYSLPNVERPDMVPRVTEPDTTVNQAETYTTNGQKDTPGVWEVIKSTLTKHHQLPTRSAAILLNSLRDSTKGQYTPYIREYLDREGELEHATPAHLIRYLTSLYDRGLSYSTINTARSAVSTVCQILHNKQIGDDILVKRFMRGIFNTRPSLPRYVQTWDPDVALCKLDREYSTQSLPSLSKKLVFLMTLLAGQRVSTIGGIKLQDVHLGKDKVTVVISNLVKQSNPGNHQRPLTFHKFAVNGNLCVVTLLKKYIEMTSSLRSGEHNSSNLFITTVKPHHHASVNTLSNWIRSVLQDCGLKNFGPHSLRGAATSAWSRASVPIDDILKAAGWRSESIFQRFYNRPVMSKPEMDITILKASKDKEAIDCNNSTSHVKLESKSK